MLGGQGFMLAGLMCQWQEKRKLESLLKLYKGILHSTWDIIPVSSGNKLNSTSCTSEKSNIADRVRIKPATDSADTLSNIIL